MSQDQSTRVLLQIKDENIKNLSTKILSDGVMRVIVKGGDKMQVYGGLKM
ncbi:hypothetical protein [Levilactobacillus zymae]|nr:hypothetical protein [Levilactobacillus zymae]